MKNHDIIKTILEAVNGTHDPQPELDTLLSKSLSLRKTAYVGVEEEDVQMEYNPFWDMLGLQPSSISLNTDAPLDDPDKDIITPVSQEQLASLKEKISELRRHAG